MCFYFHKIIYFSYSIIRGENMIFEGSAVALVTPFDKNNEINYFELKNLIDFQLANGTKAIIILGTTGESSTITRKEREKMIQFCVCVIQKRIPLIVGTGSNSTLISIELTKEAEKLGADGVLIVTPYYNKCNQDGLYIHYKKIASSTKLPIILYNVPARTGVNVSPETVVKLSKIKNIVGIKEASGNMSQIQKIIKNTPSDFAIYSGDDGLTLPIIAIGGKGVISVTANAAPSEVQYLCEHALNEDYFNARRWANYLYDLNKALFLDVNPICVKYYLNLIGFNVGKPRLPLSEPNAEIKKLLKETFKQYEN